MNGLVDDDGFELLEGADAVSVWQPPGEGLPKAFCKHCGGHVWSGTPGAGTFVGVRFGALHGDPGIEPSWRQWLASAQDWHPIPDDGVPRFDEKRS
jgi:hypothetical protein